MFVRAIRDERGFEVAWHCNECDEVVESLWGGLCNRCQAIQRRHRELLKAMKPTTPHKEPL